MNWKNIFSSFPFIPQRSKMECGPACLAMISSFYGKNYSIDYLKKKSHLSKSGVSFLGIQEAAQDIGLKNSNYKLTINDLISNIELLPCILHWSQNHFVVLYNIQKKNNDTFFYIADPGFGKIKINSRRFIKLWLTNNKKGILM